MVAPVFPATPPPLAPVLVPAPVAAVLALAAAVAALVLPGVGGRGRRGHAAVAKAAMNP